MVYPEDLEDDQKAASPTATVTTPLQESGKSKPEGDISDDSLEAEDEIALNQSKENASLHRSTGSCPSENAGVPFDECTSTPSHCSSSFETCDDGDTVKERSIEARSLVAVTDPPAPKCSQQRDVNDFAVVDVPALADSPFRPIASTPSEDRNGLTRAKEMAEGEIVDGEIHKTEGAPETAILCTKGTVDYPCKQTNGLMQAEQETGDSENLKVTSPPDAGICRNLEEVSIFVANKKELKECTEIPPILKEPESSFDFAEGQMHMVKSGTEMSVPDTTTNETHSEDATQEQKGTVSVDEKSWILESKSHDLFEPELGRASALKLAVTTTTNPHTDDAVQEQAETANPGEESVLANIDAIEPGTDAAKAFLWESPNKSSLTPQFDPQTSNESKDEQIGAFPVPVRNEASISADHSLVATSEVAEREDEVKVTGALTEATDMSAKPSEPLTTVGFTLNEFSELETDSATELDASSCGKKKNDKSPYTRATESIESGTVATDTRSLDQAKSFIKNQDKSCRLDEDNSPIDCSGPGSFHVEKRQNSTDDLSLHAIDLPGDPNEGESSRIANLTPEQTDSDQGKIESDATWINSICEGAKGNKTLRTERDLTKLEGELIVDTSQGSAYSLSQPAEADTKLHLEVPSGGNNFPSPLDCSVSLGSSKARDPDGVCEFLDCTTVFPSNDMSSQHMETSCDANSLGSNNSAKQDKDAPGEVLTNISKDSLPMTEYSSSELDGDVSASLLCSPAEENSFSTAGEEPATMTAPESLDTRQTEDLLERHERDTSKTSLSTFISEEASCTGTELIYGITGEPLSKPAFPEPKKDSSSHSLPYRLPPGSIPNVKPSSLRRSASNSINSKVDPLLARLSAKPCSSVSPDSRRQMSSIVLQNAMDICNQAKKSNQESVEESKRMTKLVDTSVDRRHSSSSCPGGLRRADSDATSLPRSKPRVSFAAMKESQQHINERAVAPRLFQGSMEHEELRRSDFVACLRARMDNVDGNFAEPTPKPVSYDEDGHQRHHYGVPRFLDGVVCNSVESSFTFVSKSDTADVTGMDTETDTIFSALDVEPKKFVASRTKYDEASESDDSSCSDSSYSSDDETKSLMSFFPSFFTEGNTTKDDNTLGPAACDKWALPSVAQLEDMLKAAVTDFGLSESKKVTHRTHNSEQDALSEFVQQIEGEALKEDDKALSGERSLQHGSEKQTDDVQISHHNGLQTVTSHDQQDCPILTFADFHELAMMATEIIDASTRETKQNKRPLAIKAPTHDPDIEPGAFEHTIDNLALEAPKAPVDKETKQVSMSSKPTKIAAKLEHYKHNQPELYKVFLAKIAAAERAGRGCEFRYGKMEDGKVEAGQEEVEPRLAPKTVVKQEQTKQSSESSKPRAEYPEWETFFDRFPGKEHVTEDFTIASDEVSVFNDFKWLSSAKNSLADSFSSTFESLRGSQKDQPVKNKLAHFSRKNVFRAFARKAVERRKETPKATASSGDITCGKTNFGADNVYLPEVSNSPKHVLDFHQKLPGTTFTDDQESAYEKGTGLKEKQTGPSASREIHATEGISGQIFSGQTENYQASQALPLSRNSRKPVSKNSSKDAKTGLEKDKSSSDSLKNTVIGNEGGMKYEGKPVTMCLRKNSKSSDLSFQTSTNEKESELVLSHRNFERSHNTSKIEDHSKKDGKEPLAGEHAFKAKSGPTASLSNEKSQPCDKDIVEKASKLLNFKTKGSYSEPKASLAKEAVDEKMFDNDLSKQLTATLLQVQPETPSGNRSQMARSTTPLSSNRSNKSTFPAKNPAARWARTKHHDYASTVPEGSSNWEEFSGFAGKESRVQEIDLKDASFLDSLLPDPPKFSESTMYEQQQGTWNFTESASAQWEYFDPFSFDPNFSKWPQKFHGPRRNPSGSSPSSVAEF